LYSLRIGFAVFTGLRSFAQAFNVTLGLTAPGCGMGPAIAEDAKGKVLLVPGVAAADVRITWEPAWNQSMISEEGKMKLGLI
jgi:metal-sulfur cluster biosynthetic enzyme